MENDDKPVGRILSRRDALKLLGLGSAAILAACASPEETIPLGAVGGSTIGAALDCVVRPELTIGPYFIDDQLNRSDIRYDPLEDNVSRGTPLVLNINVFEVSARSCTPLEGARVDVWHCDAQGAYSDVRIMPADVLIPLPAGVSDRAASTLMMKGMTAQYLFRQVHPLKGGETILYHAAAGGVGLIACQWARALGVTMIVTVSTDAKAAIARANRCTHTIVTSHEDIAGRVREITNGKGVPVVYDSVGKDTLMASLDSL